MNLRSHEVAASTHNLGKRFGERAALRDIDLVVPQGAAFGLLGPSGAGKTLILDEPMNGLDPAGIQEFRIFVRALVGEGRSVLISSHLLDEIEKTCDVVAIIDRGVLVARRRSARCVRRRETRCGSWAGCTSPRRPSRRTSRTSSTSSDCEIACRPWCSRTRAE